MSSELRRLHPAAMLLDLLSSVRQWLGISTLPWLFVVFIQGFEWRRILFALSVIAIITILSAVWGVLVWRSRVYGLTGAALYYRSGVLGRNERTVPLEHIQAVDLVQGVVQRLFNVVEVRIETAGGGGSEADISLAAVSRPEALDLQRSLAPGRRAPQTPAVDAGAGALTDAVEKPRAAPIRRLGGRRLLVAGATAGQIGVALPIIGALFQFGDDLVRIETVGRVIRAFVPGSLGWRGVLIILGFAFAAAWLIAILGTVLQYARFTLAREGDSLKITRGLLERREVTIPINRIQAVQYVENVFRQPFGIGHLRMESAGYGADVSGVSTALFPLLRRSEVRGLLEAAAPEFAVEPELSPLPARAARRYVVRTAFPWAILAAIAVGLLTWRQRLDLAWLPVAVVALAALYGLARHRGAGWSVTREHIVIRSRDLSVTTAIAPRRRLQDRSVRQSPFQRRVGLATLLVRVARGTTFAVVDADAGDARAALGGLGPAPPGPRAPFAMRPREGEAA